VTETRPNEDVVVALLKFTARFVVASFAGLALALPPFLFVIGSKPYSYEYARGAVGAVGLFFVVASCALLIPKFRSLAWVHWVIGFFSWTPLVVVPNLMRIL